MKIHEYQARQILKNFDVPVPVAEVASSPEEARKIAEEIGGKIWAVKSQIHAGGRAKAAVSSLPAVWTMSVTSLNL